MRTRLIDGAIGVAVTVVGGLILAFLLGGSTSEPAAQKTPELTIVSQSVRVPPQPIPYDIRSKITESTKEAIVARLLDTSSVGFNVVQYDLINETAVLLRDVEISAREADAVFQTSGTETIEIDREGAKLTIPPGQKVRLIAMQRYSDPSLSATYRDGYFTPVDVAEYSEAKGEASATRRIEDRYLLISQPLVDGLKFGLGTMAIMLLIGVAPIIWRYFFNNSDVAGEVSTSDVGLTSSKIESSTVPPTTLSITASQLADAAIRSSQKK